MKTQYCVMMVLIIVVAAVFPACSAKSSVSTGEAKQMEQLGNEFVDELNDMIYARESTDRLKGFDAVLVTDEKTYHIDKLYDFFEEYKVGAPTSIISIFKSKSFVVTKVVFEGSAGYYFRYEYDPLDKESIIVSSQPLDKIEITRDTRLNKVELTLIKEKKTPIVFSYKNLEEIDEAD